ncbi:NUC188 domain-containing protein [Fimicolochytrium jonesii]|uniref:NUC188 domain-containing protein n=1 Tax=Fimicolochytrium jonesii TaxID=1396493 RepID=UPI0022FE1CB8|nr:NUC188 domain-containing protein [Fimicolochytrium jonesii]KAI8826072.1 NUC188 domain-containing protein [Fimicolochytrium jonesii]
MDGQQRKEKTPGESTPETTKKKQDGSGGGNGKPNKGKRPAETTLNARERKKARQQMHIQEVKNADSPAQLTGDIPAGPPLTSRPPPRTISVVEFAEARAFEISALEKALENATEHAGVQRVFQTVPRHMRRRAASHNVKRLPRRLHERALIQIGKDPQPQKKLGEAGKLTRCKRRKKRRQDLKPMKTGWLETHIWHAKRMHIADLWNWKISEHPNDKSFRAGFRAARHQCLMQDVSYFQVVELCGEEKHLQRLLTTITDPTLPAVASARYLKGDRQGTTFLHDYMAYPAAPIGPATFLWQPVSGNQTATRKLWIWLHPAIYQLALTTINHAITALLPDEPAVAVKELYGELLRFEITGPRSNAILHHILGLDDTQPTLNAAGHKAWADLSDLNSPASLPPGVALGLTVVDPRLSFPPKMPPRKEVPVGTPECESTLQAWPEGVANNSIWDSSVREAFKTQKVTEGAINRRRAEALIPGTPLDPTPEDARVPILLLQRNCLTQVSDAAIRKDSREYVSGWDIVIPAGWGMAIWKNLVYAGARVGGLRERHMMHYETGLPCFPYDFPETTASEAWAAKVGLKEAELWLKTPPGKKVNFAKLGIEYPFLSPFEELCNASGEDEDESPEEVSAGVGVQPGTEATAADVEGKKDSAAEVKPAITRDPSKISVLTGQTPSSDLNGIPTATTRGIIAIQSPRMVEHLRRSLPSSATITALGKSLIDKWKSIAQCRGMDLPTLSEITPETVGDMLVRVRIDMLRKGVPGDRAYVYSATQEEYEFWMGVMKKRPDGDDAGLEKQAKDRLGQFPPASAVVGYVTTGRFSVAQGHGSAIASCTVGGLHRAIRDGVSHKRTHTNFALVRGITSELCLPAKFELIA